MKPLFKLLTIVCLTLNSVGNISKKEAEKVDDMQQKAKQSKWQNDGPLKQILQSPSFVIGEACLSPLFLRQYVPSLLRLQTSFYTDLPAWCIAQFFLRLCPIGSKSFLLSVVTPERLQDQGPNESNRMWHWHMMNKGGFCFAKQFSSFWGVTIFALGRKNGVKNYGALLSWKCHAFAARISYLQD